MDNNMEDKKKQEFRPSLVCKGMESSVVALSGNNKHLKGNEDSPIPTTKRPGSRRTHSFSSPSSSSSYSSSSSFGSLSFSLSRDESPSSPITPLGSSSGIPFSWEQHPGIPKNCALSPSSSPKKKDPSLIVLPLPPAGPPPSSSKRFNLGDVISIQKKTSIETSKGDPFVAALMACSRDQGQAMEDCWKITRASRTLSDRLGLFDIASCKRTCAVSDSKVLLPRSSRTG